jgi:predicted CXXCH cytochrome family protein
VSVRTSRRLAIALALGAAASCAHRGAGPPPGPKIVFEPVSEAEAAKYAKNPHDGPGGKPLCQRCHVANAPGTVKDPISICSDCHDVGLMRHPYRVEAPPEPAAAGLPLMPGRMIACHTCHDPHGVKARRGGLRLAYKDLCVTCHIKHGPRSPFDAKRPPGGAAAAPEFHGPAGAPVSTPGGH